MQPGGPCAFVAASPRLSDSDLTEIELSIMDCSSASGRAISVPGSCRDAKSVAGEGLVVGPVYMNTRASSCVAVVVEYDDEPENVMDCAGTSDDEGAEDDDSASPGGDDEEESAEDSADADRGPGPGSNLPSDHAAVVRDESSDSAGSEDNSEQFDQAPLYFSREGCHAERFGDRALFDGEIVVYMGYQRANGGTNCAFAVRTDVDWETRRDIMIVLHRCAEGVEEGAEGAVRATIHDL
jgi:hypothetical protein